MEGLTKEKSIELHRQLWNYIADETLNQKRCISKEEAFEHFGWPLRTCAMCWCCEYSFNITGLSVDCCANCPILWGNENQLSSLRCVQCNGMFAKWIDAFRSYNHVEASKLAKLIAELPENPNA